MGSHSNPPPRQPVSFLWPFPSSCTAPLLCIGRVAPLSPVHGVKVRSGFKVQLRTMWLPPCKFSIFGHLISAFLCYLFPLPQPHTNACCGNELGGSQRLKTKVLRDCVLRCYSICREHLQRYLSSLMGLQQSHPQSLCPHPFL